MRHLTSGRSATAVTQLLAVASLERTWEVATMQTPVGLYPKAGLLPAVVEVRDQTGEWDGVGQTRTLMLSDGGSVIEHTTNVDRPDFFAYNLSDFQKIFGVMVESARAEWTFTAAPNGTLIRWRYTFHSKPGYGLPLAAIIKFIWGPYMARVLPGIVSEAQRSR